LLIGIWWLEPKIYESKWREGKREAPVVIRVPQPKFSNDEEINWDESETVEEHKNAEESVKDRKLDQNKAENVPSNQTPTPTLSKKFKRHNQEIYTANDDDWKSVMILNENKNVFNFLCLWVDFFGYFFDFGLWLVIFFFTTYFFEFITYKKFVKINNQPNVFWFSVAIVSYKLSSIETEQQILLSFLISFKKNIKVKFVQSINK
jgi:hypothetical protein